jgi:hypothetical protein
MEGLIVLHATAGGKLEVLRRLPPDASGSNAFAHLEFGELCSLPENILVGGAIFLKDCKDAITTSQKVHLFEEHTLTHPYVVSDTVEHAVHIDGGTELELTGPHVGMNWSGLP